MYIRKLQLIEIVRDQITIAAIQEAQFDEELETLDMHNFKELSKSIPKVFFYLHTYIVYSRIDTQQLNHVENM